MAANTKSEYGSTKLGSNLDAKCYDVRVKLSDVGKVVTPKGAPPPSSKGSISYPKEVGKGGGRAK
jgi:hypothetical protein